MYTPIRRKSIRPITLAVILLACSPTPKKEVSNESRVVNDDARVRIDATLSRFVESGRVAGISALVMEKGEEVYFNALGYANIEEQVPMSRNTIMRIYSMTKPITGVALMKLYEQGAFQLDDPVSRYLPEFADVTVFTGVDAAGNLILEPPARPLTIRDLTRHTSGFTRDEHAQLGSLLRAADPMNPNNTLSEMARKLASVPLMAQPGEQWIYGPSVDVQALLVERLSKEPFDVFMHEHVLEPLKMNNTSYVVPESDRSRFAALYVYADGALNRAPHDRDLYDNTRDWALKPGGFGLTSTIDDYMRFTQMLVNEGSLEGVHILKPETVKLMATNQLADSVTDRMWLPSKGRVGFGIDFAVRTEPPHSPEEKNGIVGEFFWDGAASTLFWVDPVNELTAVLFVQIFPFNNELHKEFRDAVYGPVNMEAASR